MTYQTDKSLIKQLRDAALVERDTFIKFKLQDIADRLSTALKAAARSATCDDLSMVNGLVVQAIRTLDFATISDPPSSGGGKLRDAAVLAVAA